MIESKKHFLRKFLKQMSEIEAIEYLYETTYIHQQSIIKIKIKICT